MSISKAIWIDLDNSPHVPLFAPIIRHFRDRGVEVILTARDHAQTLELLRLQGLEGGIEVIGHHHGAHKLSKVAGTLGRARELASYIRTHEKRKDIRVAVSHGSRAMVLAARWLGIAALTMYDYEFTETRIFNLLSDRVMIPDRIPDDVLDSIGLRPAKRAKYPGIKEELYMRHFEVQPAFRAEIIKTWGVGVPADPVIAVVRPPATTANYHAGKSEVLFDDLVEFLLSAPGVLMIVVPRTAEQAAAINERISGLPAAHASPYAVLDRAVDGLQLAFASDLLISGGGTMNREAALLGVPVYSIFAGRQGALDRQMEAEGLITFIRDLRNLSKIRLEHRHRRNVEPLTDRVESFVIKQIDTYLASDNETR